jgi:chromosome segregation protein
MVDHAIQTGGVRVYAKGLHPGAIWKKCDFQVHTPRDPQWGGSDHLPGGSESDESAREAWADQLVAHCIGSGLQAIAITDHHDFCFVEYVRRAIARLSDPSTGPWLFPGIEVTCDDAVQCLILFDADTTSDRWNRLFGGHLLNIAAPDPVAPTNPQAVICGKRIDQILSGVAADNWLNGCSIVLPHASNDGAHKSMMRVGFHTRFKQGQFDGVYTDRAFGSLDEITKKKIYGQIPDWGSRRRGIIPTGDNRQQSFERLGVDTCWIRLGEPTSEAIRQAVLADEARIIYENPSLPNQRILMLRVDSTLTGSDFQLSFNDGFTALIGGRGSGKSAILEYLRFGLGRSASDMGTDADNSRKREQALIVDTLGNGSVMVTLERDGVLETWTRSGVERDVIEVTLPDGNSERLTILACQQRFRARAFYQKQLSTLVSERRRAGEQITGIAAAESVDRRHLIDQEIATAKREVQVAFQQVFEFWVAQTASNQSKTTVADLNRRVDAVRRRLEESGLSPENQKILDAAPLYSLVEALTSEAETSIAADIEALGSVVATIPSTDSSRWVGATNLEEVANFLTELETAKNKVSSAIAQAIAALEVLQSGRETLATAFDARHTTFNIQHQVAVEQQANLKSLIDESTKLQAELQTAEAAERRNVTKLKSLERAPDELRDSRTKLGGRLLERDSVLAEAAAEVERMSAGSLRAEVRSEVIPEQYVSALFTVCDGNYIRDLQTRCEQWISDVLTTDSALGWDSICDQVLEVLRHKLQTGAVSIEPKEHVATNIESALLGSLTAQQVNGIYSSLDNTRVVKMLTATAEGQIGFEYNDATGYIPFEQASPGQQAAALLNLLLNQEAGTLVIDQPEDDLDNKVIMKIVGLVQTTKQRRQMIFATHNPNFVVNGDADKVVALAPGAAEAPEDSNVAVAGMPRVRIDVDGAIETPLVRDAITETMEGGQAAFELRSRKYLFRP